MKKYIFVLLAALLCVILFGCSEAKVHSEMTIFNKSGAGTKTIFVYIDRDHKLSKEDRRNGDTNSVFFPKGFEPVREYIQTRVPEGCIVGFEEQRDYWVYTITYSFKNIDDYNKKTRGLIDDVIYDDEDLQPATLTVVERNGGWDVTFKEQSAVLHSIILGYVADLHFNEEIFDRTRGGRGAKAPRENFSVNRISVKIGNHSKQSFNVSNEFVEATKFISYEENQKYEEENTNQELAPTTGEAVSEPVITESAAYNNDQASNNIDKPEEKSEGSQSQKVLIITSCLIAILLLTAFITSKIRSKSRS